jgi:LPS sulfotransferase NodH
MVSLHPLRHSGGSLASDGVFLKGKENAGCTNSGLFGNYLKNNEFLSLSQKVRKDVVQDSYTTTLFHLSGFQQ